MSTVQYHYGTTSETFSRIRSRTKISKESCSHCGKEFSFDGALNAHKMIEHGEDPPHQCSICNTAFFSTQVYSIHLLNHCLYKQEQEKTQHLHCCICGLDYHSPHSLRIHISTHVGIAVHRPAMPPGFKSSYMCAYCPALFKKEVEQKKHEAEHEAAQNLPFQCDLCTMTFRVAWHLQKHKQRHNEMRILPKEVQEKYFQQVPFGGKLESGVPSSVPKPEKNLAQSSP